MYLRLQCEQNNLRRLYLCAFSLTIMATPYKSPHLFTSSTHECQTDGVKTETDVEYKKKVVQVSLITLGSLSHNVVGRRTEDNSIACYYKCPIGLEFELHYSQTQPQTLTFQLMSDSITRITHKHVLYNCCCAILFMSFHQ